MKKRIASGEREEGLEKLSAVLATSPRCQLMPGATLGLGTHRSEWVRTPGLQMQREIFSKTYQ